MKRAFIIELFKSAGVRHRPRWAACGLLLAALSMHHPSPAQAPPVGLAEVTSRIQLSPPLERRFRLMLGAELRQVLRRANETESRGPYLLSASLVRLATERSKGQVLTECEVRTTLRTARGGEIIAMFRGTGRASDEPAAEEENRLLALGAAVRSSVKRLPEALERR
jgi:hypothetical protein